LGEIAILYKRNARPDEQIVGLLEGHLRKQGYIVVGVMLSVVASTGVSGTMTVSFAPAMVSSKCSTGLVSDCTITS
jgi:hypothetical protein